MMPPRPAKKPHAIELHGDRRIDPYFWLREKENPEVRAHLEAENAYCEGYLEPVRDLQARLFDEMVARIKEDDASVPEREGEWFYYRRMEAGRQYPVYCRRRGKVGTEEIVLDCNAEAEGKAYFSLGIFETSPNHGWLAYGVDVDGSEHYSIRFKNLTTGELSPESISGASHALAWAGDSITVFFAMLDEHDRPDRVHRHSVGDDPSKDVVVFKESDSQLFVTCGAFRSGRQIFIASEGKVTSEWRTLDALDPFGEFRTVEPRRRGILYSMDHRNDDFYLLVNDLGPNFRLVSAPVASPGSASWSEVIPHDANVYLEDVSTFANHLAIEEREAGLTHVRVIALSASDSAAEGAQHRIEFPEPAYQVSVLGNPEFDTRLLRFSYSSMVTPSTVYDYDMDSRDRETMKRQEIPSGYDPALYVSERIWARSHDGARVPISIVRRRDVALNSGAPLYLYGYGSYGISMPASFSTTRLSLLDRGFIYAIAHVRGGSEMGRQWYEDGKFLKKPNTFLDFTVCAEHLAREGYARAGEIAIAGGSAGGMLVGAAMNMRPDLFRAVVAHVPFVDVLNTMLDETLPLTTTEYEEWGNPNDVAYYDCMKSYSPYDNVRPQAYPHVLAVAGFNDPRVTYWEPAKWIARLRELRTDGGATVMYTHMGAGHGGASGRYESLKDVAREYAFVFKTFGVVR